MSEWLFLTTEYIGLISAAVSGAIVAILRRLDLLGIWFLSLVGAFCGGVLRDLLLGETPPRFFTHHHWLVAATLAALVVVLTAKFWRGWWEAPIRAKIDRIHNVFDAVGLSAFTISGVQLAIAAGHIDNPVLCVFMGVITGVGGGVLRDIMVMQMPVVLHKRVYATASILGALVYWACVRAGGPEEIVWVITMAFVVTVRICAAIFRWNIPHIEKPSEQKEFKRKGN